MGNFGKLANHEPEKVNADTVLRANVEIAKLLNAYPGQKTSHVSVSVRANLSSMKFQDVKKELSSIDEDLKNVMEGEIVEEQLAPQEGTPPKEVDVVQ